MSDEDTTQPEGTQAAPEEPKKADPKPPWGSDEEFSPEKAWNLIQNLRGDLDKAKPAIARVKELEDASKSEAQKLAEDRDSHKARAETAEAQLMRLTVGLEKGLTPAQAKRLVGTTKEELEADADELLASFGSNSTPSTTTRPRETLRGGGDPTSEPEPDLRKIADAIPRR
jgi:hypothetical protein